MDETKGTREEVIGEVPYRLPRGGNMLKRRRQLFRRGILGALGVSILINLLVILNAFGVFPINGGMGVIQESWIRALGGGAKEITVEIPLDAPNDIEDADSVRNDAVARGDENAAESFLAADNSTYASVQLSHRQCAFETNQKPTHAVLISEIAWMGGAARAGETALAASGREWIELHGAASRASDLFGAQLIEEQGTFVVIADEEVILAPGGYVLFERKDDGAAADVHADEFFSGSLQNDGMWLRLFDRECALLDEINASSGWFGGENDTKRTLERDPITFAWHTSVVAGGTPRAKNSEPVTPSPVSQPTPSPSAPAPSPEALLPSPSPSPQPQVSPPPSPPAASPHVLISELQITGGAGDASHDVVKLYNAGSETVYVGGWKLRKRTQSGTESSIRVFPDGLTIAPGGSFVWANSSEGFAASIGANVSSTAILSDNNSIALFDVAVNLLDAVAWGSGHTGPYIEGTAYSSNPAGNERLARKINGGTLQDTNNNGADFEIR